MKKLLQKIKSWFVLRWKELQSIQRDKKSMKTEREVRKVEFSKKHPVYTIVTRVIAVLAALAVAIGFTCVSCRTLKDIEKQSTVNASAESIPEVSSGVLTYSLQDVPQFIEIDIPSVPFDGYMSNSNLYVTIQHLFFPRLIIDIQGCSIYQYSTPVFDGFTGTITSFETYNNISACPISIWFDDGVYANPSGVFVLDDIDVEYTDSSLTLDTFNFLECTWSVTDVYSLVISLYGDGGVRRYSFAYNSVSIDGYLFDPYYTYFYRYDVNGSYGSNTQYTYYDYLSKLYFNHGYYDGYDAGEHDGYFDGYDIGYTDGYDDGYDDGDLVGYNRGLSQSLSDVTPWQVIVDGVNHFFGLSILGNSVTIGMIMSIGFGCILFGFAIKIFLGG